MTRQEARERYGLTTRVYRQGFEAFKTVGLVKIEVRCPKTFVVAASEWLEPERASNVYDALVHQVVLTRMRLPPPPAPIRFHRPFDS
jgi:hypothetical protein